MMGVDLQVIVNSFDWGKLLQPGRQVPHALAGFRPVSALQPARPTPQQHAAAVLEMHSPASAARDVLQECRGIVQSLLGAQVCD